MAPSKKPVFDVAKPGESDPEPAGKPMVIGHASKTIDPDVKEKASSEDKPSEEQAELVAKKQPLKPVSEDVKPVEDTANEPEPAEEATTETEDTAEDESEEQKSSGEITAEERAAMIQDLIKSKKYFVPIKKQSSKLTAFLFFLIIFAVASIGAYIYFGDQFLQ